MILLSFLFKKRELPGEKQRFSRSIRLIQQNPVSYFLLCNTVWTHSFFVIAIPGCHQSTQSWKTCQLVWSTCATRWVDLVFEVARILCSQWCVCAHACMRSFRLPTTSGLWGESAELHGCPGNGSEISSSGCRRWGRRRRWTESGCCQGRNTTNTFPDGLAWLVVF